MELLSDMKPNNKEAISRKAVNLKEFVQEDTAVLQTDNESPLTNEMV